MFFWRTLSVHKLLYFVMNVCVLSALALLFSTAAFSSQTVKITASATSGLWKNVTFVYPQQMNVASDNPLLPHSCAVIKRSEQGQTAVQCQAQVKLVRPAFLVTRWQQEQARDGYFIFSEPELGAVNVHAQITKVSPGVNLASITPVSPHASPVTGIFIKYTTDVRQYTFRDEVTGRLSKINATPNHPFYVTNAQQYKAVGDLSQKDHLINIYDHFIALVCPQGKTRHCGQFYHAGQITPVYNLEVYQHHRYFVGEAQILVHNVYKCKVCNQEFLSQWRFRSHVVTDHSDHMAGRYFTGCNSHECGCDICQLGSYFHRTHATGKYKCIDCQHEFSHFSEFKAHRSGKSGPRIGDYECPECGEILFKRSGADHLKKKHPDYRSIADMEEGLRTLMIAPQPPFPGLSKLNVDSPGATTSRERSSEQRDRSRSPIARQL